jgi:hypothetical protein
VLSVPTGNICTVTHKRRQWFLMSVCIALCMPERGVKGTINFIVWSYMYLVFSIKSCTLSSLQRYTTLFCCNWGARPLKITQRSTLDIISIISSEPGRQDHIKLLRRKSSHITPQAFNLDIRKTYVIYTNTHCLSENAGRSSRITG